MKLAAFMQHTARAMATLTAQLWHHDNNSLPVCKQQDAFLV
jgi:hypothetical protein